MGSFPSGQSLFCPLTTGAAGASLGLACKPRNWPSAHSPPTFLLFKVDLRVYYYLLTFTEPLLSRPHLSAWSSLAAKYQQGLAGQAPEEPEISGQKLGPMSVPSWLGRHQGMEAGLRCMGTLEPWRALGVFLRPSRFRHA